jgi:putative phosphoesterase
MIAIISDIHSNLEAFEKVLSKIRGSDFVLHAGDLVGYGPDPKDVIRLSKLHNIISVKGNHDQACVSENTSGFNQFAAFAARWTANVLDFREKRYLSKLPEVFEKTIKGKKIIMVHGSPGDHLNEYVYPHFTDSLLTGFLELTKADILILGHTHEPFIKKFGKKFILNPGSVGQPRDGNPKASFVSFDKERMKFDIKRVKYDIAKVQEKILRSGLPAYLAKRLEEGL